MLKIFNLLLQYSKCAVNSNESQLGEQTYELQQDFDFDHNDFELISYFDEICQNVDIDTLISLHENDLTNSNAIINDTRMISVRDVMVKQNKLASSEKHYLTETIDLTKGSEDLEQNVEDELKAETYSKKNTNYFLQENYAVSDFSNDSIMFPSFDEESQEAIICHQKQIPTSGISESNMQSFNLVSSVISQESSLKFSYSTIKKDIKTLEASNKEYRSSPFTGSKETISNKRKLHELNSDISDITEEYNLDKHFLESNRKKLSSEINNTIPCLCFTNIDEDDDCDFEFIKLNVYSLDKYNEFLEIVENQIYIYLCNFYKSKRSVNRVLYSRNMDFLSGFRLDLFEEGEINSYEEFRTISSIADMLNTFFQNMTIKDMQKLIVSLKKILKLENNQEKKSENYEKKLKKEIIDFLQSEASVYVKSIITEFYSFEHLFYEIEIDSNYSVINAFIMFLIIVKRSNLNTVSLKDELKNMAPEYDKFKPIHTEIIHNYALFFVFICKFPFKNSKTLIYNTKTCILCSYFSHNKLYFHKNKNSRSSIRLLKHFFFDLRNFDLFFESNKIFISKLNLKLLQKESPKIYNQIIEVENFIIFNRDIFFKRLQPFFKLNNKSEKFNSEILKFLNGESKFCLHRLFLISELAHTILVYLDCKVGSSLTKQYTSFYKQNKLIFSRQSF